MRMVTGRLQETLWYVVLIKRCAEKKSILYCLPHFVVSTLEVCKTSVMRRIHGVSSLLYGYLLLLW